MRKKKNENKDTLTITRKIKIYVVDEDGHATVDEAYKMIRGGMAEQAKAMNLYMSSLFSLYMQDATEEDRKAMHTLFSRDPAPKHKKPLDNAYPADVKFLTSFSQPSLISNKAQKDFAAALKVGVQHGNMSLPSYKKTDPLMITVDFVQPKKNPNETVGMFHKYADDQEFRSHLQKKDLEVFVDLREHIRLKMELGRPKNAKELRSVIGKIFDGTYHACQSMIDIQYNKKDNKNELFLLLSVEIPVNREIDLDEDTVVGTNNGLSCPACCAVNNSSDYYIEDGNYYLHMSAKIQSQRKAVQGAAKNCRGGHGRKKKIRALDRFRDYEANFKETYNHQLAKKVVDFAIKHRAKYINIEYLGGYAAENDQKTDGETKGEKKLRLFLKEWTYFQFQSFLTYKAAKYGIEVRYVNPAYDSLTCSCCGEKGERRTRKDFYCTNPSCSKYGERVDADYNAAKNVSLCTEFLDEEGRKLAKKGRKTKNKKLSAKVDPKKDSGKASA